MKYILDIRKIKGSFKFKGPIKIKITIGGTVTAISQAAYYNEGAYGFFQKHVLLIQNGTQQFQVKATVVAQSGLVLSQIMVFFNKFKALNKLKIQQKQVIYELLYSLTIVGQFEQRELPQMKRRNSSIGKEDVNSQSGKLQILKMGVLFFKFVQRLDPLVFFYGKFLQLLTWKKPYQTILFGVYLTVVIYHFYISILTGGVLLYFGRGWIFKKVDSMQRYQHVHQRLIIPEQNAVFLQTGMQNYCSLYENLSQFLFSHDKTFVINGINLICRTSLLTVILLFFFEVENVLVMSVWTGLLLTSPFRGVITVYSKPIITFLLGQSFKILDIIGKGLYTISSVLTVSRKIQKPNESVQFYFYHYQRWWMFKGWQNQKKKYSDEDYECILTMKQTAPEGYAWIQDWKLVFEDNMDSDGYQYSNDFAKSFKADLLLNVRRRRKWKRMCLKIKQELVL